MATPEKSPDERAREHEAFLRHQEQLAERIRFHEARARLARERDARRRERLRRLSFGLLGRDERGAQLS
jgi:hypothetical protein